MPELPDLEVFKGNIFARLTSKTLKGLEIFNARKVQIAKKASADGWSGRDLRLIDRFGKELFFDFGDKMIISAHLMLNGEISIVNDEAVGKMRNKIFAMKFENETVVFSDRGGLCTIKYMPSRGRTPDAFGKTFTFEYFEKAARSRSLINVKTFLIDQSVVKGIGNAYADEILYAARISPYSLTGKIPPDKLEELYGAIGTVLRDAIESIKRIAPDLVSGEERSFLKVHNKAISKTETGFPIKIDRIASKITYYTEEQILY